MLIGIVAGEESGDILGAGLMQQLRQRYPEARFMGVGGPRMLAQGFVSITPMERLSVMGFVEPLGRLPELLRLKRDLLSLYQRERPAVFIGIDSPGFNLRLEQPLRASGIKTVHYVSPSVWAWGEGRIKRIAQCVDLMLTLFPFESEIYRSNAIPACCVGHPLADETDPEADQQAVKLHQRDALGLASDADWICLMPGSRRNEVQRLAPVFLDAAIACLRQRSRVRFIIPCANDSRHQQLVQMMDQHAALSPEIRNHFVLLNGQSHEAMQACDLVVQASGTATLEAMLLQRPMVVCYKLAPITWMLASRMLRVPWVALPNLLAGRQLVPEYLQHAATPEAVTQCLLTWLNEPERTENLAEEFARIHRTLKRDANRQAAEAVAELIEGKAGG
ncbi:MAG: lipid-A-disaccharide synthase [Pseudomonadota bacterium]|nr:lipid-A-disaccharide synthase [Pseudomonadota bacterium]